MGTSPKFVYYTKECRDKGPLSCCTKKEPGVRNFDARRVSRSILHEILGEMHKVNERPRMPCRIIKIPREVPKHSCKQKKSEPKMEPIPLNKPSSMSDLIIWNVSKALQTRPCLDLKSSIKAAEKRLSTEPGDLTAVSDQHPEQQYLLCALLAWHQLGHHSADSLYKFVKPKMKERSGDGKCDGKCDSKPASKDPVCSNEVNNSKNASPNPVAWKNVKPSDDGSFGVHTSGPVLTLPMEPKFILRVDNTGACNKPQNSDKPGTAGTTGKLDAACCLDKQCVETLAELDKKTNELRARAFQLMQHEGTRAQLLGRAEEAWTDLEKNYQKQLTAEKEKGKDMEKQVKNMVTERNVTKVGVKAMAEDLTKKKEGADLAKQKLTDLEKLVIDLAATKLRLSEEAAKGEAAVAEELARVLQYERDLMFNEDQARRKLNSLMNESDSARALTCETERALRAELAALRDQIENVSKQLQTEEDESSKTKAEQDQLRQEKKDLIEDLENCKSTCDKKMQWLLDDLRDRKKKLLDLQDQVLECRCKVPTDASVQVKRTASLVALCHCAPEDHLLESCSCTSMRSRLLTNLLTDLFSGLQSELGNAGGLMPCHMLKCLEDQHVWDKPSQIKTNIRNFFSKLLKNELNIAIATSIEFYHATWVGTSCADAEKMEPTPEDDLKEGWQKRAIERRAQQLANKLVKDLYHDKFEHIKQPCDCQSPTGKSSKMCKPPDAEKQIPKSRSQTDQTELYPCLVSPYTPFNRAATTVYQQAIETLPPYWKKTIQDVTQLKLQIEDLKKDSIKKEDLKVMEENISKIVREASVIENEDSLAITRDTSNSNGEKKEIKNSRVVKREESPKTSNQNKSRTVRRKDSKGLLKKGAINEKPTKQNKKPVHGQTYAVNICLGAPQKNTKSLQDDQLNTSERSTRKQNSLKTILPKTSTIKQIKPINVNLQSPEPQVTCKSSEFCDTDCKCFNKTPSNASIDRLLQTLVSWKYELTPQEKCTKTVKRSSSKFSKTAIKQTSSNFNQNDSTSTTNDFKKQVYDSDINNDKHSVKAEKQNTSFMKQPITTESEYMGTVYLDKSHENICKCLANIESTKEFNNEECDEFKEKVPFQCINTHTCDCNIPKKMQRDHKRSQTMAFNLHVTQSNCCQHVQSKDFPEFDEFQHNPKSSSHISVQKEMEQKSNMNNVPLKTELYSNNSEYFIKFLGVTLNDLNSDKIKKIKIKPVDYEPPKKLSNIGKSNSLTKPLFLTKDKNNQSVFNDCSKCECKAKFEEFTSLMTNIFDKKLHENSHKDKVIDPQNVKCAVDNIKESCVCCNDVNVGDSKDLEVNAFHLLEDHIKEKIKEFKRFSCIPPEEEEKLFSTILQRVKEVISDCANNMKCGCPGGLSNSGSWNRAYGLLQEYLKIKIKRVQCLCVMNDRKDVILPEVLDKVCNLIESDFKRLKDICTCENNTGTRTNIMRIGDIVLPPPTELPEKDTNTSQAKYNDRKMKMCSVVSKLSKRNSNNSIIIKENISAQVSPIIQENISAQVSPIIKENISAQVPPYLGMEAKSCDIMEPPINKNARTTETDQIITESKSNGIMYNTCDCCDNTDKVDILKFPDMFGTKEVLVNLYTEQAINTGDIYDHSLVSIDQVTSGCLLAGEVETTKSLTKTENSKSNEKSLVTQKRMAEILPPIAPYIGYTVDCSCDDALGSCFCIKSVVQSNNDKIDSLWKGSLLNDNKQFSYIMHGNPNQNNSDVDVNCYSIRNDSVIDQTSTTAVINDDLFTCEAEILAENVDDLVLKFSLDNVGLTNQAANTVDVESSSLETAYSNSDFFAIDWIKSPLPAVSGRSHAVKLTKSIYYPGIPIDNDQNSFTSGTTTDFDTQKTSESCVCDKVPICHVKMLVEHIEKNLVESKCTCDSLISKVCPVHSKRDF